MTLYNSTQHNDILHNDNQRKDILYSNSIVELNVAVFIDILSLTL